MNEVELLRAAIEAIRMEPKFLCEAADHLIAWLEGCASDLEGATRSYPAAEEDVDPMQLVDEPDSVRRALALARVVVGQDPA